MRETQVPREILDKLVSITSLILLTTMEILNLILARFCWRKWFERQ